MLRIAVPCLPLRDREDSAVPLPKPCLGRLTAGRRPVVEGSRLIASRNDGHENAFQIVQHLTSGNSQDREPRLPKLLIPLLVELGLVTPIMCLAIHFDCKPRR